jgi:biopolymer transport protein ExbD
VKERMRKYGEFPVLIRADYDVRHADVARVMNACTANGIWKISFMATAEDKRSKPGNPARPHLNALKRRGN